MDQPIEVPFPTSSSPGVKAQESSGRLINAFAEGSDPGSPGSPIIRRSPGLRQLVDAVPLGATFVHTRGFLDCGAILLWIVDGMVLSVI